jgi:tRNA threonylcarbamoyladenosine biosynthesis protein TsaB
MVPPLKNNLILCIETATEVCSVAISDSGKCIAEKTLVEQKAHGTQLTVMINAILAENHFTIKDLSAVAYSSGPGSYTGLRIGLSVTKGICYGAEIPLIEVSTLLSIASDVNENIIRFPMIDARRMEVYAAIVDPNGKFIEPPFACLVEEYDWTNLLKDQKICFVGNGVEKSKPILSQFPNAFFHPGSMSAATLCSIANQKFTNGELANLAYHVPFYLKDANVSPAKKKLL